jgi:hypothetical protein
MSLLVKFRWLGLFLIILCMAILRPIHQDDGWYASFAFRILDKLNIFSDISFFSFSDVNGGNDKPAGFLFSLLQVPFFAILGINVLSVKIFNSILLTLLLYLIHLISIKIAPNFRWVVIVLFIIHPVFYYHFYNRPEILALLLSALSFYLILISNGKKIFIFFAYFIWAFIIDVHPIAIFTILGFGIQYWILNRSQTLIVLLGGFLGVFFYIMLNYFINDSLGLFSLIKGHNTGSFGDHYLPLFSSDLNDYLRIAIERCNTLRASLIFSLIWIIIPILIFRKPKFSDTQKFIVFNSISFWILATFFSEASSNGFALYSIYIFLLFLIILLNVVFENFNLKLFWKWLMVLPLFLFLFSSTIKTIYRYYGYYRYFNNEYLSFSLCIENGSNVLMRPIFAFNMGLKSIHADYTFGILNVMLDNKISFEQAIRFKNYDYVILDERNLIEEILTDKRSKTLFLTPAYFKYRDVGVTSQQFNNLILSGFLKKQCEFDEISHGKTVIYKVFK